MTRVVSATSQSASPVRSRDLRVQHAAIFEAAKTSKMEADASSALIPPFSEWDLDLEVSKLVY